MKAILTLKGTELPNLEITIALPRKYCSTKGYISTASLASDGYDCILNFPNEQPGFLNTIEPSEHGIEVNLSRKKDFYP